MSTGDDDAPYSVALNIGAPPSPDYVVELAEAVAEAVRVLNHQTRHHEALHYPSEADRVIQDLRLMASRLPQLCAQLGAWLDRENAAGRIGVPSGKYAGDPALGTVTARVRLDAASAAATILQEALDSVATATSGMTAREEGGNG